MQHEHIKAMYLDNKMSIPQIGEITGIPVSTVRNRLIALGTVLRSRGSGQTESGRTGGAALKGKRQKGPRSPQWCRSIALGRKKWAAANAAGVSLKPSGYLEITTGQNKGRLLHVVIMEQRIGRRLSPDECVHHIDENKTNNSDENLAFMTKAAHSRLHRLTECNSRRRSHNGRFA
jgi:hypothetical protein